MISAWKISVLLLALAPALPAVVETECLQVAPWRGPNAPWERSPTHTCAILLLQGLRPHTFSDANVFHPVRSSWQEPASQVVQMLGKESDVFSFAYAQNAPLETDALARDLASTVLRLRQLGYSEITLIGHSAGGLIARRFVEDNPDAGVTKVIQVCAPNAGSGLGKATISVRQSQQPFLRSLSKEARQLATRQRADVRIPAGVQFVCVVGTLFGFAGDGAVLCTSQWSDDLQAQGIPAVKVGTSHLAAIRSAKCAELLADLVRQQQPRWSADEVQRQRTKVLKE